MKPTLEWQVAGACNYDCSYCIQSPKYRRGRPEKEQITQAIAWLAALPGVWEIKMSGGEAFAHPLFLEHILPSLVQNTPHTLSVLTNFSATRTELSQFLALARPRLQVFSASYHHEFADLAHYLDKICWFAAQLPTTTRLVVNQVVLPGRMSETLVCKNAFEQAGIRWFPQLYKTKTGVAEYPDQDLLSRMIGTNPTPMQANLAPTYWGRLCHAGHQYGIIDKDGGLWSCRTAKKHKQSYLGSIFDGSARLQVAPQPCPYHQCPCTVPANRGMIQGINPSGVSEDAL